MQEEEKMERIKKLFRMLLKYPVRLFNKISFRATVIDSNVHKTAAVQHHSNVRYSSVGRYSYISADVPYITVILYCSAENAVGGRALIRCYSYNIENSTEISWEVLPHLDYSSYTWTHDGQNQKIY